MIEEKKAGFKERGKILDLMKDGETRSFGEIEDEINFNPHETAQDLEYLKQAGMIEEVGILPSRYKKKEK